MFKILFLERVLFKEYYKNIVNFTNSKHVKKLLLYCYLSMLNGGDQGQGHQLQLLLLLLLLQLLPQQQ